MKYVYELLKSLRKKDLREQKTTVIFALEPRLEPASDVVVRPLMSCIFAQDSYME
jgi:hypothetical protein